MTIQMKYNYPNITDRKITPFGWFLVLIFSILSAGIYLVASAILGKFPLPKSACNSTTFTFRILEIYKITPTDRDGTTPVSAIELRNTWSDQAFKKYAHDNVMRMSKAQETLFEQSTEQTFTTDEEDEELQHILSSDLEANK